MPVEQDHEHRAIGQIPRPIDQSGDFVRGEDRREPAWDLWKRQVFQHVRRFSVFTKKNRSAETWSFTVRGPSFRSRSTPDTSASGSD